MRKIYIDSEFKCHIANDGTMTEVNTTFFDGACNAYIEGYRFIPSGKSWKRSDGKVFHGEMIAAWKPYSELDNSQREYEKQNNIEYAAALLELGVEL